MNKFQFNGYLVFAVIGAIIFGLGTYWMNIWDVDPNSTQISNAGIATGCLGLILITIGLIILGIGVCFGFRAFMNRDR
jgi:hypothetical protein